MIKTGYNIFVCENLVERIIRRMPVYSLCV